MLETLYEIQCRIEEKLYNYPPQNLDEYVDLMQQHLNIDEMILKAGGKSGIVLDY